MPEAIWSDASGLCDMSFAPSVDSELLLDDLLFAFVCVEGDSAAEFLDIVDVGSEFHELILGHLVIVLGVNGSNPFVHLGSDIRPGLLRDFEVLGFWKLVDLSLESSF